MNGSGSGAATQICSHRFDQRFFALPVDIQRRVQEKIDEMGKRLRGFSPYHMEGEDTYRLRVGNYRVIYQFHSGKMSSTWSPWDIGGMYTNKSEIPAIDRDAPPEYECAVRRRFILIKRVFPGR